MRLIDADALKMEFPKDEDWDYPVNTNSFVCELIDAQPTIEPEPQWIPMSEHEPKFGNYLTTFRKKDDPKDERDVTIDYYASYGWDDDGFMYETLAWMPLPESYKGE